MKKLKLILSTAAIITGTVGAFALHEDHADCTTLPQYYYDGIDYKPVDSPSAGNYRSASGDSCTYVSEDGAWRPCCPGKLTSAR